MRQWDPWCWLTHTQPYEEGLVCLVKGVPLVALKHGWPSPETSPFMPSIPAIPPGHATLPLSDHCSHWWRANAEGRFASPLSVSTLCRLQFERVFMQTVFPDKWLRERIDVKWFFLLMPQHVEWWVLFLYNYRSVCFKIVSYRNNSIRRISGEHAIRLHRRNWCIGKRCG